MLRSKQVVKTAKNKKTKKRNNNKTDHKLIQTCAVMCVPSQRFTTKTKELGFSGLRIKLWCAFHLSKFSCRAPVTCNKNYSSLYYYTRRKRKRIFFAIEVLKPTAPRRFLWLKSKVIQCPKGFHFTTASCSSTKKENTEQSTLMGRTSSSNSVEEVTPPTNSLFGQIGYEFSSDRLSTPQVNKINEA